MSEFLFSVYVMLDELKMIEAITSDQVARAPGNQGMLTFVFAHPNSVVLRDLNASAAYIDIRSGLAWNLFVVGYAPGPHGQPDLVSKPQVFDEVRRTIPAPWRYSGLCDLVSVMAYQGHAGLIDWSSMRSVTITGPDGGYTDRSIGEISELMADWHDDPPGLADYAAGEPPAARSLTVSRLAPALGFLGNAVGGGVLGNTVYDLLKALH
ncbi:hypothetical protein [Actinomadura napierensis]|uniref:Uncharacterized protein n=1 Tax=Actinomadura napierensis TaxID=267854 RepID=A0ABN2Y534_9ACTN